MSLTHLLSRFCFCRQPNKLCVVWTRRNRRRTTEVRFESRQKNNVCLSNIFYFPACHFFLMNVSMSPSRTETLLILIEENNLNIAGSYLNNQIFPTVKTVYIFTFYILIPVYRYSKSCGDVGSVPSLSRLSLSQRNTFGSSIK